METSTRQTLRSPQLSKLWLFKSSADIQSPHECRANSRSCTGLWFTCLANSLASQKPHSGGLLFLSKLFQQITSHNNSQAKEQSLIRVRSIPVQVGERLIISLLQFWGGVSEQALMAVIILLTSKLDFFSPPLNISENLYPVAGLANSLVSLKLRRFNILWVFFFPYAFFTFMKKYYLIRTFRCERRSRNICYCARRHVPNKCCNLIIITFGGNSKRNE